MSIHFVSLKPWVFITCGRYSYTKPSYLWFPWSFLRWGLKHQQATGIPIEEGYYSQDQIQKMSWCSTGGSVLELYPPALKFASRTQFKVVIRMNVWFIWRGSFCGFDANLRLGDCRNIHRRDCLLHPKSPRMYPVPACHRWGCPLPDRACWIHIVWHGQF